MNHLFNRKLVENRPQGSERSEQGECAKVERLASPFPCGQGNSLTIFAHHPTTTPPAITGGLPSKREKQRIS